MKNADKKSNTNVNREICTKRRKLEYTDAKSCKNDDNI